MDHYRESAREDRSLLVVAFDGYVFGVSAHRGEIRWQHVLRGREEVEILLHRERVYASDERELVCLETATGRMLYQQPLRGRYVGSGRSTMVIEGDRLFVGSLGNVACFWLECEPLWTQAFSGVGKGSVALGFRGNFRQADDRGLE